MAENQLTLMAVHAHPDDETTSGGGTLIKYQAEGVRTVLVTCTDGAEGEIHDPELDEIEARPRLTEIRALELARAVKIMNISAAVFLGYRDSGMAGTPANDNSQSFHQAPLKEAAGRLVKLIRQYQPQVMFTYDSFGGYGHPDHIKAHKIAAEAFDYASDLKRYPQNEYGPAWQPSKLYTTTWSRTSWQKVWEVMLQAGEEWPFQPEKSDEKGQDVPKVENVAEEPPDFGSPDNEITTFINVTDYYKLSYQALTEHRTQIDAESSFWAMFHKYGNYINSTENFILFKSVIPAVRPEYDLFAGIR